MQLDKMAEQLANAFPGEHAVLDGDGYKFEATVVSEKFDNANTLARHKLVYAAVDSFIKSGELHALSIKAYSPSEWEAIQPLS
ncbi:MAG: BolA family protein [Granulosicoccaceae bacterium]